MNRLRAWLCRLRRWHECESCWSFVDDFYGPNYGPHGHRWEPTIREACEQCDAICAEVCP